MEKAEVKNITDAMLDDILKGDIPVLVNFHATWCPPCRMMEPVLEKIADAYKGKIDVYRLNTEENPIATQTYNVKMLPTSILFRDGYPAGTDMRGSHTFNELKEQLDSRF